LPPPPPPAPDYFGQVELGTGGLSVPNSHLDVIGKVAVDSGSTGHPFHMEFAGLMTQLGFYNPVSGQRFSARGAGGSLNAAAGLVKGLTFLTANYYSDGGGRFIFGEAPGSLSKATGRRR